MLKNENKVFVNDRGVSAERDESWFENGLRKFEDSKAFVLEFFFEAFQRKKARAVFNIMS